MYRVKHCIVCNQELHAHKKKGKYVIKNACEHVDTEKTYTEAELRKLSR
jgi:hypothetical protein